MLAEPIVAAVKNGIDRDRLVERATELVRVRARPEMPVPLRPIRSPSDIGWFRDRACEGRLARVAGRRDAIGFELQFNGHLDTVHLPFVEPSVEDGILRGSGASDMKGGVASFVEAMFVLRETGHLTSGSILMTGHDHHEGPWGDKRQLKALIRDGYVGDAVMLPEYLAGVLPLRGRGMGIFRIGVSRPGDPVHEVLRSADLPNVVAAAARMTDRLYLLAEDLKARSPGPGIETVFIGQLEAGEIYNQAPVEAQLAGTRRWTMPGTGDEAIAEVQSIVEEVAQSYGVSVSFKATRQGGGLFDR